MTATVTIGAGRVRVPHETYALYLAGASSVALLERDGAAWLLPLAGPVAGGLLLKQSNARGDRVVLAPDFLAAYGLDGFATERSFAVHWVTEAGALRIEGLTRC